MDRLSLLAVQLSKSRRRGNRLTLECILESARILSEARAIARRGFGAWLTNQARMDRATAARHLKVARFVRQNVALMQQIRSLSLAKLYALSGIDSALAIRVLTGQIKFTLPLDLICDVQFRREFRALFPARLPKHTRHHVFQSASSALARAQRAVKEASAFLGSLTASQRHKIESRIHALAQVISEWKGVA